MISREERDDQLSPSKSARNVAAVFQQWADGSEQTRTDPGIRTFRNLHYGTADRQMLDLYTASDADPAIPRPVHVFIHGGFWQEGSKDNAAFPARTFIRQGWVYVAVGYTLAPAATLTDIIGEICQALAFLRRHGRGFGADPDRIVITGHSAGGHLAACLLTLQTEQHSVAPLLGIVSISGVYDLEPIRASYVDAAMQMTKDEVARFSPARARPCHDIPVALVVGSRETAEFIRQTELLAKAWATDLTSLSKTKIADRDHFDILLDLCDPTTRLFGLVTDMLGEKDNKRERPS